MKICDHNFKFIIIVLIGAAEILANENATTEPEIKNAEVIKEYKEHDNTSFAYR